MDYASELFARGIKSKDKENVQIKEAELLQPIEKLQIEIVQLKKSQLLCRPLALNVARSRHPELSVTCQCALLVYPRSMLFYQPTMLCELSLRIIARIGKLYLEDSCSGGRRMVASLGIDGILTSRSRLLTLMHCMCSRGIHQRTRTTILGHSY